MSSTTAAKRVSGPVPAAREGAGAVGRRRHLKPPSRSPRATAARSAESSSTTSTAATVHDGAMVR